MAATEGAAGGLRSAIRRFSTFVILCTIVGGVSAGLLSYRSPVTYSGQAVYLVPPGLGAGPSGSLTPFDAERVARTYAVVLAEDAEVLAELGDAVDRDPEKVAGRIQSVRLPSSSAIRVTYLGADAAEVRSFFEALTDLAESSDPPTANLAPDTLRLLRGPQDIVRSGGGTPAAPLAGALAGLLLGLAGAALLTRADPRVEDADDLREPGGPSVLEVDLNDDATVEAAAIRALDGSPQAAWVAVVSTTDRDRDLATAVTSRLEAVTRGLVTADALPASAGGTRWVGAPLGSGRGERAAQDADRTVLVVPAGAVLRDVASRLADLRDLGVTDVMITVVREPRAAARRTTADTAA